jgi:DNA-directed RNA polymerase-3 subunit RPC5
VKERVGRVEVELPVDGTAEVWRDDKAREMGFVTDVNANGHGDDIVGGYGFGGKEKEKDKRKKSAKKEEKWGDKARLRSEVVPNATGYYSGVVHDGESRRQRTLRSPSAG